MNPGSARSGARGLLILAAVVGFLGVRGAPVDAREFEAGFEGPVAVAALGTVPDVPFLVAAGLAPATTPFPVPFGPGERLDYQVKLGALSVGNGHMSVNGIERVRGRDTYHVVMAIEGGVRFVARVDNHFESWMDVETLASHRFVQDQDELRTKRVRRFEFFPDLGRWDMTAQGGATETGSLETRFPLDDISFVYYARALPLEVGRTYTLNQYFRADRNPVILRVVRRDRVTVPAGTFNTIVVQPVIKTRGIFGEGGEAELHFSDDSRRLLVQMRSRVPLVGSLSLHLRSSTAGRPLVPFTAPPTRLPPGATPATRTTGG
jgi:hypothetical protein